MNLNQRIDLLAALGDYLQQDTEAKEQAVLRTAQQNSWLTIANCHRSLANFASEFLQKEKLEAFVANYAIKDIQPKKIGLILAGNIPAVGFHDVLCTFLAGHHALIKCAEKDSFLIPFMIDYMVQTKTEAAAYFTLVERLKGFDAVIATGSDNSARYFKQYFAQVPHIIRNNRNSVAVLEGNETDADFRLLVADVFDYFGLGCRSVSKLFVPEGYVFDSMLRLFDEYKDIMDHNKFKNNYDYNRSVYLLNGTPHLANDCLMVLEHESPLSRIAALHYEYYKDIADLKQKLEGQKEALQCIATKMNLADIKTVGLGQTQCPAIDDFADGVDTLQFLIGLN